MSDVYFGFKNFKPEKKDIIINYFSRIIIKCLNRNRFYNIKLIIERVIKSSKFKFI